jgi:hypothetical protein
MSIPSKSNRETAIGIRFTVYATPSTAKVGTNFAGRSGRSRYSSLADQEYRVCFCLQTVIPTEAQTPISMSIRSFRNHYYEQQRIQFGGQCGYSCADFTSICMSLFSIDTHACHTGPNVAIVSEFLHLSGNRIRAWGHRELWSGREEALSCVHQPAIMEINAC